MYLNPSTQDTYIHSAMSCPLLSDKWPFVRLSLVWSWHCPQSFLLTSCGIFTLVYKESPIVSNKKVSKGWPAAIPNSDVCLSRLAQLKKKMLTLKNQKIWNLASLRKSNYLALQSPYCCTETNVFNLDLWISVVWHSFLCSPMCFISFKNIILRRDPETSLGCQRGPINVKNP